MEINSPKFFIEINKFEYIFGVGDHDENKDFQLIYKNSIPLQAISNNRIIDFDLAHNTIKENIYLIEQKFNYTFKDVVLILNNFHCSFVNLTGYKKLNGSQILKDNITYILNSLKLTLDESEKQKTVLHIFNSKFCLDKKEIENLPIGLFGDFYSHELSFSLINNNDYKNLNSVFDKCNLKIKKILLKNFIEGTQLIDDNKNQDTFFKVVINEENSQLIYFDNAALKFVQNFEFGSNLILSDISKITSLTKDIVKKILSRNKLNYETTEQDYIEKELFENVNYRKIKKKLIFEIAAARIQEFAEIFLFKNINLKTFQSEERTVFLNIKDKSNLECFKDSYKRLFFKENHFTVKFIEDISIEETFENANMLVNFGWKKEAIPVIHTKKSFIAKFFEILFN